MSCDDNLDTHRRGVSILEARDYPYDASIREFAITGQGLRVAHTFDTAEVVLRGRRPSDDLDVRPRGVLEAEGQSRQEAAMKSVLVVDDEFDIAEAGCVVLADEGYEVRTAVDGQEALARLAGGRPDLTLQGLMMPQLDGRGVLRAVRADASYQPIPVVSMSARVAAAARSSPSTGARTFSRNRPASRSS